MKENVCSLTNIRYCRPFEAFSCGAFCCVVWPFLLQGVCVCACARLRQTLWSEAAGAGLVTLTERESSLFSRRHLDALLFLRKASSNTPPAYNTASEDALSSPHSPRLTACVTVLCQTLEPQRISGLLNGTQAYSNIYFSCSKLPNL